MSTTLRASEQIFRSDLTLPPFQKYERYIYWGLGLHGAVILGFLGGSFWAWTAVFATLGLGLSFYWQERFALVRPVALVIISWVLVLATGGAGSYLQLWFFVTVPLYSFMLERPYGLLLPFAIAIGYFLFIFITPTQLPTVVALARTALHLSLGWLSFTAGSAYRKTIHASLLARDRYEMAARAAGLNFFSWDILADQISRIEMSESLRGNDETAQIVSLNDFFATVHPDDREAVKDTVLQAVAQQSAYRNEFRILDENGRIRWLSAYGTLRTDSSGKAVLMVGCSQDITERKTAVQRAEDQANLLNIVSDAVIATDENFVIRSWNKAAESIYGWEAAEVEGKMMGTAVPTEYVDESGPAVRTKFLTKGFWQGEVMQTAKNGEKVFILSSVSAITNGQGKMTGAVAVNRNITERKQAESALKESEALYRTLVETVPMAVTVVNEQLEAVFANQTAATMFGADSPDEILGTPKWHIIPAETSSIMQTRTAKIQNREATLPQTYQIRRMDGRKIVIEASSTPVQFRGKPATLAVARDVTEKAQFEEAVRVYNQQLARAHEIAQIATWQWNIQTDEIVWSDEMFRLVGLEVGAIKPSPGINLAFIHPDDRKAVQNVRVSIRERGQVHPVEFRITRRDGQERFIWATGEVTLDENGRPQTMLGILQDITERKKAEAALLQSEERFRTIVEKSLQGIFIRQGNQYVYANAAFCEMTGLTQEEIWVTPPDKIIHPDDFSTVRQNQARRLRGELSMPTEFRVIQKNGETRWLLGLSNEVIYDGKPSILISVLDITEKKKAAASLQRSEAHLLLAQATAGMGSWEYYPDTDTAYWSREMFQIYGRNPQLPPPTLEELQHYIHPDYREQIIDAGHQVLSSGEPAKFEYLTNPKNGPTKFLRAAYQPVFSEGNKVSYLVGTVLDITEIRQTEHALFQEAQRNRLILNTMQDGYVLSDGEGRIVDVNSAYCTMIGYSREELLTMQLYQLDVNTDLPDLKERLERMLEAGYAHFEAQQRTGDGRLIDLEISGSFLEAGGRTLVASFVRNITSRKQAEADILQHNREMTSLLQISQAVSQLLNLQELLEAIVTAVIDTIPNAEAASIWFYNEQSGHMIPRHWKNYRDPEFAPGSPLLANSLADQILKNPQTTYIPDTANDPRFKNLAKEELNAVRSVLAVPFFLNNAISFIFFADCFSKTHAFTDADMRWLQSLTGQLAVMVQNARLYTAEKRARETAEILQEANLALTKTLHLGTVLDTLLVSLEKLIPYDTANVMLRTKETEVKVVAQRGYTVTEHGRQITDLTFDPNTTWSINQVVVRQKSIIIPNTYEEPRWELRPGAEHVMCWMGVPLVAEGKVIGLYAIDKSEPNFFTNAHLRLAQALSAQAAIAVRNAQLLEALNDSEEELHALAIYLQSARENERKRISHEIHDEFGQLLTAIKINLAWLHKQCNPEEQHILAKIESMTKLSDDAIAVARRVARELRPGLLDDLGLTAALDWHLQEFTRHTHITTSLSIDPALDVDRTELAVTLYRIVQEALTNVARHARATAVEVTLHLQTELLELSIADNGRGITESQTSGKRSLGLLGIRERVRSWQGEVQISGQKGVGTSIIVQIPQKSFRNLVS